MLCLGLLRKGWRSVKRYFANCNLHGTRYLVENDRHWTERLFWIIFCALSWWGCADLITKILSDYHDYAVGITVETTYLHWETKYPSISVCLTEGRKATEFINQRLKPKRPINSMLANKLFFTYKMGYVDDRNGRIFQNLSGEDLTAIYEAGKINCTEVFAGCKWNNVEFNCCDEFQRLQTLEGYCYVINSRQATAPRHNPMLNFSLSKKTGLGILLIEFQKKMEDLAQKSKTITTYLLNDLEIPAAISNGDRTIAMTDKITHVGFTLQDTFNEETVKKIPYQRRKCRFSYENDENTIYKFYSYDACITEIQMERMLRICGCVGHIYPRAPSTKVCNFTELKCIVDAKNEIMAKDNFRDLCYPDCEQLIINRLKEDDYLQEPEKGSVYDMAIRTCLNNMPLVRYRRYEARSLLDVIVSVGSAMGLFTGASVLSLVEVPYWLFVRRDD